MKIAIPVDENRADSTVCVSFGRAPYFMLCDTVSGETSFTENSAADAPGGAGLKAAQLVADLGADVLLTVRCGQNAAEVLAAANVGIYRTEDASASGNLSAFAEGRLDPLTHFHAGFQGRQ